MGQRRPDHSRIGTNLENLRRRDPKSRERLNPLFGQVAVATVRNVLFTSVAKLQRVDELLSDKVAELRAMQASQAKLQDTKLMQKDPDVDCAQQSEGLEVVNGLRVMLRDEELQHRKE